MSKASKKRACPALGSDIFSADCGANRISRYACPATCPHLPFAPANYSHLLELEDKLDRQSMDYFLTSSPDRPATERALQKARLAHNPHYLHAFYEWNLFFARDAEGRTCAERWEKSSVSGLKNDDLVLLRAKMQTRVALLEIHRVIDGERLEAVDLLAPGQPAIRLQDRRLASTVSRFSTALVWIYPLPHYWRLSGTGIVFPDLAQFEPREIVTEIVSHLGGPTTEPGIRLWLAENLVRFDESLLAVARLRRMQMLAGLDAKFGKAIYELRVPFGQCRDCLDELPGVEPDQLTETERSEGFAEARVWLDIKSKSGPGAPAEGQSILGRVLLGQSHWRLESFGAQHLARLRQQFEAAFGNRAFFSGERLDDLGGSLAAKEPEVDKSLAPSRLLQDPQQFQITSARVPLQSEGLSPQQTEAEYYQEADRLFLDDHVPALDGRTPREAANDAKLRSRLLLLLKQRVRTHDERNLRTGRSDDINWLLRELGVDEILFDPPPWRPPPVLPPESEFDDEFFPGDPNLPIAPPLPAKLLSIEDAARRLDEGMSAFSAAAEALDSLPASGITLVEDACDITADWLDEDELGFAITFILQAIVALVPPGHRAPPTSYESLEQLFLDNEERLYEQMVLNDAEATLVCLNECSQPHLMMLLNEQILNAFNTGPKKLMPAGDAQPVILALVKSVVEELDRVLRP